MNVLISAMKSNNDAGSSDETPNLFSNVPNTASDVSLSNASFI